MFRIIIADDEEMIRKRLTQCIPWEEIGYEIAATAADGEELFKKIEEYKPDVVLTDIKMPEMDGLEVISRTHDMGFSDIEFIIISGYSDFEYAQKGIKLGVSDYILKPIDKQKLMASLKGLSSRINKVKENKGDKLKNLIKSENDTASFEFKGTAVKIYIDEAEQEKQDEILRYVKMCLNEIMTEWIHIDEDTDSLLFFYESILQGTAENMISDVFLSVNEGISNISENGAVSVYYSDLINNIQELKNSVKCFDKIKEHRPYIGKKQFININKISYEKELINEFSIGEETEAKIESCIAEGDYDRIRDIFSEIPFSKITYRNARIICFLFINMIYRILNLAGEITEEDKRAVNEFLKKFEKCEFVDTIKICTYDCMDIIFGRLRRNTETSESYIISQAMMYIDQNIDKNISLRDIAGMCEVSYGYLSRIFALQAGGFVNVLRKKRINIAKKLLETTNKKVYEIAIEAGFKNSRYFTEVFKKETGIIPQEYRNKYFKK